MKRIKSVWNLALYLFLGMLFVGGLPATSGAQPRVAEKLKTANNDLRGERPVFRVKAHQNKKRSLALIETGENQFMVDLSEGAERKKISSSSAKRADGKFVKDFIHIKYAMDKSSRSECEKLFTLEMRGETESVCGREKKRAAKARALIKGLEKEFKIKR